MRVNSACQIWQFDCDDTLINWDRSAYPDLPTVTIPTAKGDAVVTPNQFHVNLLIKLSKVGWYIRVHSGSGSEWAHSVVRALKIEDYVDEVCAKPRGETDDMPSGDGIAYRAFRNARTGKAE